MRILADENIAPLIVDRLRQEGYQIEHIAEIAKGSADVDVLGIANEQGAILLTDDKDFGDLVIYQQRPSLGVILLRLKGVPIVQRAEVVVSFIQENEEKLVGAFTVITFNKNRIIRLLLKRSHPEIE